MKTRKYTVARSDEAMTKGIIRAVFVQIIRGYAA